MSKKARAVKGHLTVSEIRQITKKSGAKIHFVGIGGVSMYSLAAFALNNGFTVSGSDREASRRTDRLIELGASVYIGDDASEPPLVDAVIYSHAIPSSHPTLLAAESRGIPTLSRAEYMGALMPDYTARIGISGSHGKSSVTAMLDSIFEAAGIGHATLSGADLPIGEPYRIGSGALLYEACEYRDSFLHFLPTVAVALNLELDHTDYFADIEQLRDSFRRSLKRAQNYAIINAEDENLAKIKGDIGDKVITFGYSHDSDYRYQITEYRRCGFVFSVYRQGRELGSFELNIPGSFNVANATAAIAVATEQGIDKKFIAEAISTYRGIDRRLQPVGMRGRRMVYYDYAHHPTEIAASISALRQLTDEHITVIFKPHTYSRTAGLWLGFVSALSLADHLILTDIYAAREEPIDEVSSQRLASAINGAIYCSDDEILRAIDLYTRGTIVIMGAGDLEKIKNQVLNK